MDLFLPFLGSFMRDAIHVISYPMIALTLYYYVIKPMGNLLYLIYYAHRFNSIPSHPIYGHLKYLIPKFPNANYDPIESTKNFYRIMMESNDPVTGSNISVIWVGWLPLYIVSGATGVEAVLNKSNISKPQFYKFIGLRDGLVTSHPDKWRQRRKIIEPFFKTKRHQYFLSIMNKEISKISDQIADKIGVPYDMEALIHRSALNIILEVSWGIPCVELLDMKVTWLDILEKAEVYFIQRIYNPLFWYDGIYKLFDVGKKYKQNLDKVQDAIAFANTKAGDYNKMSSMKTINNNDESANNYMKESGCLLDFLHKSNETSKVKIDEDGISEELLTMAAAGHETISIGMRWTLFILGNNPEIQERLYQEIINVFPGNSPVDDFEKIVKCKYLEQCLKESLRLNPPIHGVGRQLDEDIVINGTKIYKNSVVILNFSATHHDASVFPNPKKYDPDRWSAERENTLSKGAFTPFALGPRNCIGYRYALIEMKVYLIHIIRRFNLKSLLRPEDVHYRFEIALKPTCPLEIIFTPRE